MKRFTPYLTPLTIAALPFMVYAQTVESTLDTVTRILNFIIPILMVIATIVFLWGVIIYITSAGDEEKISKGKSHMLWGIIGLFVMVAVWGIVRVLVDTFGFGGGGIPPGPGRF